MAKLNLNQQQNYFVNLVISNQTNLKEEGITKGVLIDVYHDEDGLEPFQLFLNTREVLHLFRQFEPYIFTESEHLIHNLKLIDKVHDVAKLLGDPETLSILDWFKVVEHYYKKAALDMVATAPTPRMKIKPSGALKELLAAALLAYKHVEDIE